MIDWVSWPLGRNIDQWIIALLKGLAAVKKFSILIEVSLAKIEKVGGPLSWPLLWLCPLASCQGQCRSEGSALAPPPKRTVTWDNSLSLFGPQVPSFIPLTTHSGMCMLLLVCLSIP